MGITGTKRGELGGISLNLVVLGDGGLGNSGKIKPLRRRLIN